MAEIDKTLPNVKQTINVPSPEEIEVDIQEEQKEQDQPIDVQENFGNSREDIMRMLREELLSFMKPKKATGGRVQAASGGLVGILKL